MFRWDHFSNQQQRLSGRVNGAAWGRIFGKQDCNRADSLPRAVLTHARQNNSVWANRNQLQPRIEEAPHWLFQIRWLLGAGKPHSSTPGNWPGAEHLAQKAPVPSLWNFIGGTAWCLGVHNSGTFPQEVGREATLHLQVTVLSNLSCHH